MKYCIIGYPLKHSVSPEMQNSAFRYYNMDAEYVKLEVNPEGFSEEIRIIEKRFNGANVTIPFKEEVAKYYELVGDARAIRTANTIDFKKGLAYNTDVYGALKAIEPKFSIEEIKNIRVLVVGAGGAGKAVSYGLVKNGAVVLIHNRTESRALNLVEELRRFGRAIFIRREELEKVNVDMVVNATPLGMHGFKNELPLPEKAIQGVVFDTVYNPMETKLIRVAKEKGCDVVYGIDMLVYQGAKAFEIWTGKKAPVGVMRDAALKALETFIKG
ncbi:shikimate dehydrogenase [Archaeoglobus sulfaticallidus PM70-1]|uniref:Shikimate dehydrogenase (NADP(+)) n=1 Tax=Archaeoglobus sulfaticallidus PM70-1 TaxID=387631 RepID=N0BKT0_9EURY|nr:shikimate dehydrogenase [Archaeoglobus sulfaticallidus]AGK61126.1 shikimate dehydrogenase [Archaeoglobus sulfaticallidus PM70-1]